MITTGWTDQNKALRSLENTMQPAGPQRQEVIRKGKLILYNTPPSPELDTSVVTVQRYGCFGATMFPGKLTDLQLTAGVTSTHTGEGKTTVAANLAAFFATDTREDTVIVDVSFRRPRLHQIFGMPSSPGLLESVRNDTILLYRTAVKNLWLLPIGYSDYAPMDFDKVVELRESIATLKRQFRFIVLDLPGALQPDFPVMLSSQLDGYFLVVAAGQTRSTDIREAFQVLNEKKIIGFIMNRRRQ